MLEIKDRNYRTSYIRFSSILNFKHFNLKAFKMPLN
jgi:hypothetical protein